jgi:hypothetical protein
MISCFASAISSPIAGPTVLYDTAQIGIEVAVPTINGLPGRTRGAKGCRKDVVIWAESKMTVGDSDFKSCREPLSVMLWKVINQGDRKSQQVSSRPSTEQTMNGC